ncbi:TetR/AcrR family transcriptional regulator [Streptomyces sp. NPDC055681]
MATMGRRERLRTETTAEIKSVALELMATGGPGAITLRAIARRIGMTPNALYGYFATRDDLVTALIDDVYTSLADAVDVPVQAADLDTGGRIKAWAHALRTWALANPEGFRLIYGDAVPGYQPPEGGAAPQAELRFCTGLLALAAAAWPHAEHLYVDSDFHWSDFDPGLLDQVRPAFPDIPPAVVALTLRIWGHLHGLISLEVHGHLHARTTRLDKLYDDDVTQLLRSLNLERHPAASGGPDGR